MNYLMIFNLIGGLGLFIYGMKHIGNGLQAAAGKRLKRILEVLTNNRIMGILVGTGVTSIIQSSSATIGILMALQIPFIPLLVKFVNIIPPGVDKV